MTLGERLTSLRESRGWTKTFVSKKLGIKTVSTYANYEYGIRQPDHEMILKIADLFDVSTDLLLGNTNTSYNSSPVITTDKEERDIAIRLEKFKKEIETTDGLAFNGEPISDEAKESLIESMEHLFRQTQRINKKYTPNKYK